MKKKKVVKNRRNQEKYPALRPELNLKTRQELIDYDYLDKLSPKELQWLNDFTEETVNTKFDRDNLDNNINFKLEHKQEADRANNRRKTDLYLKLKVGNMLDDWEDYKTRVASAEEILEEFDELSDSDSYPENGSETSNDESDEF